MIDLNIDDIKNEAEKLLKSFDKLNSNISKLPNEKRTLIFDQESKLHAAINMMKNEFGIKE